VRVGIITGSASYSLADLQVEEERDVRTRFGNVSATMGRLAGVEVVHLSRHGEGHARLSNHVNHRAHVLAMRELGAQAVIGLSVCGAVDPTIELGSLIVFDDLHFPANRLPDGSLCSLYDEPGTPGRGHWIFEEPFSEPLRSALLEGLDGTGVVVRPGGCYGHVDGPRFNTRSEIRMLAACGVCAVSQTAGPETVLCGEAELPYALVGYATDYANGVRSEPTPVAELMALVARSTTVFASALTVALPRLAQAQIEPTGANVRWD